MIAARTFRVTVFEDDLNSLWKIVAVWSRGQWRLLLKNQAENDYTSCFTNLSPSSRTLKFAVSNNLMKNVC